MDRYQQMFSGLSEKKEGAFIPFVTLGDPDKETSIRILETLLESGADALELGIPFSDPIADGPTLQRASIRALNNSIKPSDCFAIIKKIREKYSSVPIGLLLYSNLILAKGVDEFYQDAADAGVDSILVADAPVRVSAPFFESAKKSGVKQVLIAPPNATDETLESISLQSEAYTYLLGRSGVTGAEVAAEMPAEELLGKLKSLKVAPPVLGFGISKPEQVAKAVGAGAAGAISGSATVNIIEENLDDVTAMLKKLSHFVAIMKKATKLN